MLSIWCMVRRKVIGLIVFNKRYVYCDRHFLYEKPKPCKTDTAVFSEKLTKTEPEITAP